MATILETKQALSDIRNELRKEQQRGVAPYVWYGT